MSEHSLSITRDGRRSAGICSCGWRVQSDDASVILAAFDAHVPDDEAGDTPP